MPDQFSLTRGGPVDRLLRRIGLTSTTRRAMAFALIAWLPLLIIAYAYGRRIGQDNLHLLLLDYPTYARFLVAIPIFWLAETIIEARTSAVVDHFRESGLVDGNDLAWFDSAAASVTRSIRATAPELLIAFLAYAGALLLPSTKPQGISFEASPYLAELVRSTRPAVWWYTFVSIPLYNFLFYRWVWRIAVWTGFLGRISRLNLRLTASHPDLAGGLGFLAIGQAAFWYIAFAGGCIVSAVLAQRIVLGFDSFASTITIAVSYIVLAPLVALLPLILFSGKLIRLRVSGIMQHSTLANDYTRRFEKKWIDEPTGEEELLGTSDLQSLADLGNSFEVVRKMRIVPFGPGTVYGLVAASAVPILPLVFTKFPVADVMEKLARALF